MRLSPDMEYWLIQPKSCILRRKRDTPVTTVNGGKQHAKIACHSLEAPVHRRFQFHVHFLQHGIAMPALRKGKEINSIAIPPLSVNAT